MKEVFVYGALRSGTTLLRVMLDGNPRIDCRGEADFLFDYLHRPAGGNGEWEIDFDGLKRDRIYQASGLTLSEGLPPHAAIMDAINQMRRADDNCVAIILHRNLDLALALFPQMAVLHKLRDPRDVARSSIGMGWAGHAYYGVDHWVKTETLWQQNAGRIAPDRQFELRYETLIEAPEPHLRDMCAFLELPYTANMLSFEGRSSYSAPDVSLIEQWRRKMSQGDVALVEQRVGRLLEASGYTPSGFEAPNFGILARARLSLSNRAYIWKIRIKRYGLRDPLLVAFARKLRWPALARSAQKRINIKHLDYLK